MTDNKIGEEKMLEALNQAKDALAKLPILGPALWLYARDPAKKFMFVGDTDWAVLPPIVLDQCRLYTRAGLPYAFVTWAFVNDVVDARLRSAEPKIAPHEWKSGEHIWLIDAVAPFGQLEETLKELREGMFPGQQVCALLPNPKKSGQVELHEWFVPNSTPTEK
ncbi:MULTISPECIES: toxin-activating lysine-acyltransferase [unclassified Thiobacillus]|uniref:toxin-activating lysine-acyltransferase n=1 Tax=unclassified Thiobacillus TaxID=2646513 RepID=UPI00086C55C8|nr:MULTISPECIES: toxin-activating lysine-acyltransferase [unclassified Thiobacillus]ODV00284.1 MAG: toxin-activating lysine-acyltransferase [Thiobacillus sp. SCN 63-57]